MVEPIFSSVSTAVATKLLGRTVDDLYEFLKGKVSLTIDKARIQRKIPELVNRINSFRMVKTLWQMERPVDVEKFYCTSHVLIPTTVKLSQIGRQTQKKRRKIDCVSDFGNIGNIVIKGIAGQGKSIFLRHLFIREFELGQRIPVFIELRKIQEGESLLDHIARFLDVLDLGIDPRLSRILARSGKLIFFLDAYDEVPEIQKQRTLNELEYLVGSSPGSQFLVTTRPDSGIEMSSLFTVVNLDDLRNNEYLGVIRKLSANVQFANTLIKSIQGHKATICDLLCTPLLITLLIIQYNSFPKLPEQMSDFYESIFDVLLRRHDRSKPGFVRQRLCSLNDNQYREIFNAFCFESMKVNKSQLSEDDIRNAISRAMKIVSVNEDPLNFLNDITRITCLVLHEGEEYRFIHKSVQEYYAASFIKNRPDSNSESFYSACLNWGVYRSWKQELMFLSETDRYRYHKYYLLPLCRLHLNADSDDALLNGLPPTQNMLKITHGFCLTFSPDSHNLKGIGTSEINQILPSHDVLFQLHIIEGLFDSIDYTELVKLLFEIKIRLDTKPFIEYHHMSEKRAKELESHTTGNRVITIQQAVDAGFSPPAFIPIIERIAKYIYDIWQRSYSYTRNMESFDITSQLHL